MIWSLSTSIGLLNCGASFSKKPHRALLTCFFHLLQTLQKSFFCVFQLNFFTFLKIIKHKVPKMLLFSSIFNIKMTIQKFTSFDAFFKKNFTLIWLLLKYNLTKLFPVELKTTECYLDSFYRKKKKNELFGQPNIRSDIFV